MCWQQFKQASSHKLMHVHQQKSSIQSYTWKCLDANRIFSYLIHRKHSWRLHAWTTCTVFFVQGIYRALKFVSRLLDSVQGFHASTSSIIVRTSIFWMHGIIGLLTTHQFKPGVDLRYNGRDNTSIYYGW